MRKIILIMLVCILTIFCASGCASAQNKSNTNISKDDADNTFKTTTIDSKEQESQHDELKLEVNIDKNEQKNTQIHSISVLDDTAKVKEKLISVFGNSELVADPFLQDGILSWEYSIDIRIDNGNVYIHDILYDNISLVSGFPVVYGEGILLDAYFDEDIFNTLKKISEEKYCYILETNGDTKFGKQIAVYNIDGVCYFLRFYDNGQVMRIHLATTDY